MFRSPPGEVRSIAISAYVCLSVYPLAYLKNHMTKLDEVFSACYLWPWRGPLTRVRCIIVYFRFCE